jgi:hypothetical protein
MDCTAEESGFNSRQWKDIVFFSTASRTALGHTQWIQEALSMKVKRLGRKVDLPSSGNG